MCISCVLATFNKYDDDDDDDDDDNDTDRLSSGFHLINWALTTRHNIINVSIKVW